jgi:hypothetical protein
MLISITRRAVVAASVMAVPALLAPCLCAEERRRSVASFGVQPRLRPICGRWPTRSPVSIV